MTDFTVRYIDQRPLADPRPVEMQVLCLGLSRTGTMSMYTALRKLGYKSYHFIECSMANREEKHLLCWNQALQIKLSGQGKPYGKVEFDKILGTYSATTDAPCVCFADDLLRIYPNAKVIHTDRDPDKWIASVERSFFSVLEWREWNWLRHFHKGMDLYSRTLILTLTDFSVDKKSWQDRNALKEGFIKYNEHIRAVVPKERLLEYKIGDGWEPICKFLGKPVPDEPYPWVNEGDNTDKLHMKAFRGVLILFLLKGLLWSGGVVAAWMVWRYWYSS